MNILAFLVITCFLLWLAAFYASVKFHLSKWTATSIKVVTCITQNVTMMIGISVGILLHSKACAHLTSPFQQTRESEVGTPRPAKQWQRLNRTESQWAWQMNALNFLRQVHRTGPLNMKLMWRWCLVLSTMLSIEQLKKDQLQRCKCFKNEIIWRGETFCVQLKMADTTASCHCFLQLRAFGNRCSHAADIREHVCKLFPFQATFLKKHRSSGICFGRLMILVSFVFCLWRCQMRLDSWAAFTVHVWQNTTAAALSDMCTSASCLAGNSSLLIQWGARLLPRSTLLL